MLAARQLSQEYRYQEERIYQGELTRRKRRAKKTNPVTEKLVITGCVLFAMVVGLMLTATQAMITDRADKIIQAKTEISNLQNGNERLKLEIAELKSLDRIEQIARTELGMVSPEPKNIQYLALSETETNGQEVADKAQGKEASGIVGVKTGEKMHPALHSLNKMVTGYVFGIKQVEASQP